MVLDPLQIPFQQTAEGNCRQQWQQGAQDRDQTNVVQQFPGEKREDAGEQGQGQRDGQCADAGTGGQRELWIAALCGQLAQGGRNALLDKTDQKDHRGRNDRIAAHRLAAKLSG